MPIDAPTFSFSTEVNALADQLAAEMRHRWAGGDRVVTEDFVSAHPALRSHPGAVGELIYEEVSLRREHGEPTETSEILQRFPQWAAELRVMLELREALEADGSVAFPEVGEQVGEFDLLADLGRGSRGRVYLARQPALADRPVVVKVSSRANSEHLSLARLQHTHIVPLYFARDEPTRGIRLICMPFFGGTTLAHVLTKLDPVQPSDRTPVGVWDVVAAGPGRGLLGPALSLPSRWVAMDYTRLIAHIGVCLAEALQFAHDRGLVHMDVKPSNILLTGDGLPMLLDFHLARPPVPAGEVPPVRLGCTAAYCAPEQRAAVDAVRSIQLVPVCVDRRADVYALGAVLFEALTGRLPSPGVPASRHNRRVSFGLSDIVARCLASDPADRNPETAALAEDLRRHLASLPLCGVRNRSITERWVKWRRRRPYTLGAVAGLLIGLVTFGLAAGHIENRREVARAALEEGNAELVRGRVVEARGAFRRGLAAAEGLPVGRHLEIELERGIRRADRVALAAELHAVAEGMRALSVTDAVPPADREMADRLGRELWERRVELFALAAADLPPAVCERARNDLFDVVLVWCHQRAQSHPAERPEVLKVLAEIEAQLGPCAGLYLERAVVTRDLGRAAEADADVRRADATPDVSARDHVVRGTHQLRHGNVGVARAEFERGVDLDPHSFWARLALGRCELALGHADDAMLSFAVCVGLEPDNPVGHLHKGHAHARLGQRERALSEVDRALALDPNNSQARTLRSALAAAD